MSLGSVDMLYDKVLVNEVVSFIVDGKTEKHSFSQFISALKSFRSIEKEIEREDKDVFENLKRVPKPYLLTTLETKDIYEEGSDETVFGELKGIKFDQALVDFVNYFIDLHNGPFEEYRTKLIDSTPNSKIPRVKLSGNSLVDDVPEKNGSDELSKPKSKGFFGLFGGKKSKKNKKSKPSKKSKSSKKTNKKVKKTKK